MQKEYKVPFWKYFLIFCPCVLLLGPLGIIVAGMIKRHIEKEKNEELSQEQHHEEVSSPTTKPDAQVEMKNPPKAEPKEITPTPKISPSIPLEGLKHTPHQKINAEKNESSGENKNSVAIVISSLVLLSIVGLTIFGVLNPVTDHKKLTSSYTPIYSEIENLQNEEDPNEKPNFTYEQYRDLRKKADKTKQYNTETSELLDSKFGSGFSDAVKEEAASGIDSVKNELLQVINDYNKTTHRFSSSEIKRLGAKSIAKIQMQSDALLTIMNGTREENIQRLRELEEKVSQRYAERFDDREVYFFCRTFYSTDSNGKVSFSKINKKEKLYLAESMTTDTMTKMQKIMSEVMGNKPAIEYPE